MTGTDKQVKDKVSPTLGDLHKEPVKQQFENKDQCFRSQGSELDSLIQENHRLDDWNIDKEIKSKSSAVVVQDY